MSGYIYTHIYVSKFDVRLHGKASSQGVPMFQHVLDVKKHYHVFKRKIVLARSNIEAFV